MVKSVPIYDFCEHIYQYVTVFATYAKFSPVGDQNDYAKLLKIDCKYSNSCNINENECPLYNAANTKIFW